jgi:hypothetical protein
MIADAMYLIWLKSVDSIQLTIDNSKFQFVVLKEDFLTEKISLLDTHYFIPSQSSNKIFPSTRLPGLSMI